MEITMEALSKQVSDMQALLVKLAKEKGQVDGIVKTDAIWEDELAKMRKDIMDNIEVKLAESRKPLDKSGEGTTEIEPLNQFLCKVKRNDPSLIKTAMSEGTGAQGGYTVPTGYDSKIFGAIYNSATVVPKCTAYPHGASDGFTKKIPRWLTGVTITNSAEAAVKVVTKPTLSQPESVLKKMTAIVVFTDELLSDNISSLDNKVAEVVGKAIAVEQERQILVGNTGAGDPFMGIGYAVGVNSLDQKAGGLAYSDFVRLLNYEMLEQYHTGAEMYMRRSTLALTVGMVDGNNRPIFVMVPVNGKVTMSVLGVPINISSTIPKTLGTGSNQSIIIYGNYENVLLGHKEGGVGAGIQVDVATQAIISTGTEVTINLWTQDETGFRFVKRHSVVVIVPSAFVKLVKVK